MKRSTLRMLNEAREIAGIPFTITSGYRSITHNVSVGGVNGSAHTKGYAVDISAPTFNERYIIARALAKAGFPRIGIGDDFIHADNDPELMKVYSGAWGYPTPGTRAPFDPFN